MRQWLTFFLFILYATALGQLPADSFIHKVEEGIGKQVVAAEGSFMGTKNIRDVLKAQHVNGISVAVINNHKIEWAEAYGVSDKTKTNPVTTETLFQCASIGKMITALAALHLVKDGLLVWTRK